MKIGELSRCTGVSVRMLRHYETLGLLEPARRSSGYRIYGQDAPETVARILALNAAGVRLETIRPLLPCGQADASGFAPCAPLRERLQETLAEIDRRIATLERNRQALRALLAPGQAGKRPAHEAPGRTGGETPVP